MKCHDHNLSGVTTGARGSMQPAAIASGIGSGSCCGDFETLSRAVEFFVIRHDFSMIIDENRNSEQRFAHF